VSESYSIGVSNTSTPGADSNTYIMFDSTTWPLAAGNLQLWATRIKFGVENSHLGTLKAYHSIDKGTNWDQVGGDIAVAAAAATDISGPYDYLVDTYKDFRLSWVNGGSAQTTWRPVLTITRGDRASGT
jgi:hypothetical protein